MQDLRIDFTDGPMAGESKRFDLGAVALGREPIAESGQVVLTLRGADASVSRNHVVIVDNHGQVLLRNLSGNGTTVDGKLVLEEQLLKPGSIIRVGNSHEFTTDWQLVGTAQTLANQDAKKDNTPKVASQGMLGSPIVRALLAVYLLGIVAVAVWMSLRGEFATEIRDEWPTLSAAYEDYQPDGLTAPEKLRRTAIAESIIIRLRVHKSNERNASVQRLCRELMRLDADIQSPLYRYGAQCLGKAK